MGEKTLIQWTDITAGPFFGCSEVSCGCRECYARDLAESRLAHVFREAYRKAGFPDWETMPIWGDKAPRVLTKGFWTDAYRLNKKFAQQGKPQFWFPSMIDWLDKMPAGIIDQEGNRLEPLAVLGDFLNVIRQTRWIYWQLLTKRPENFFPQMRALLEYVQGQEREEWEGLAAWLKTWLAGNAPLNILGGVTVENQKHRERLTYLIDTPFCKRFVSCEPLLEDIDLLPWLRQMDRRACGLEDDPLAGFLLQESADKGLAQGPRMIHQVIVGGESGPNPRECNLAWVRSIVRQCREVEVAVFVKQLGARPVVDIHDARGHYLGFQGVEGIRHLKGGEPNEWPEDIRIREMLTMPIPVEDEE